MGHYAVSLWLFWQYSDRWWLHYRHSVITLLHLCFSDFRNGLLCVHEWQQNHAESSLLNSKVFWLHTNGKPTHFTFNIIVKNTRFLCCKIIENQTQHLHWSSVILSNTVRSTLMLCDEKLNTSLKWKYSRHENQLILQTVLTYFVPNCQAKCNKGRSQHWEA